MNVPSTSDDMTATFSTDAVEAGQAVYSPRVLDMYDWFVLGVSNRLIWRCPTSRLEKLYATHITGNHLDVGVGTGYFLDRCPFPIESPRIGLMDLNELCLQRTSERIARYQPQTFPANVLEPIPLTVEPFDSIGINYLLHCLPGSMEEKAILFDHLLTWLTPGGVIFGSTLLSEGVQRGWLARRLMKTYNGSRVFSNEHDTLNGLNAALESRFDDCQIQSIGCAALFSARKRAERAT